MSNIGGNALVIKEINLNLVRKVLKEKKQATKKQIADTTGLSIVTVGTMLQQLTAQQEVLEVGLSSSSGGRPAQQYAYNDNYAFALILFPQEQGGASYIHSRVVNLSGNCVHESEVQVEAVDVLCFEGIIDNILEQYPSVQAIGFGLPGAEVDGTMVVSDYDGLRGVPVAGHFSSRYGRPVVIENDVNAAVIGYCHGAETSMDASVVYLYFPERFAPGAGIYLHGKLYKGRRGFAGEIGNLPLGILWGDDSLLSSFDAACEAAAKLVVTVSSVLNPDTVVVSGSLLGPEHMKAVSTLCSEQLPPGGMPEMRLSADFAADYTQGMIVQTLRTLEPNLQLTK
ncbi:ROK family protein [Paenibacillus sp. sgz500958]|uniref:ROK family protein n=1 Tax=Paenibacillus sp. sgz500958 TaxID=3242475 RepID=UPI0036D3A482